MSLGSLAEAQIRLLADGCNRAVLTVLDEAGRPLHAEELAERLVDREVTVVETADYEDRLDRTLLVLHHDRLPRLAEAGFVEYDCEENVVTARDAAASAVEWQDGPVFDELESHLGAEEGVGVVEGRGSILRYGRRLADEAEEELFCMFVSTDLLEEECIRRAENAVGRGVQMYVGSRNPEVRDLVRERLPEATVWEPQLDWTNTPTHSRVGRLVLVDRRKVMLAVLEEPDPDGADVEETALVGDGEDHPLVVLVRELLGSRLDHLDHQSEDFRSRLPS